MDATKQDIENAILFFAKRFNQEINYKALIASDATLPKLVEMIVYEMFLQEFCYHCNYVSEEFKQYNLLLDYGQELKQNGWVSFK